MNSPEGVLTDTTDEAGVTPMAPVPLFCTPAEETQMPFSAYVLDTFWRYFAPFSRKKLMASATGGRCSPQCER